jgi:WD40 repeat protein
MPGAPPVQSVHSANYFQIAAQDGRVFAGDHDGKVFEISLSGADAPPQIVKKYRSGHQGAVRLLAISADASAIASAGTDFLARIHDTATGEPLGKPLPHPRHVMGLAFTPDQRFVVSACLDGSVRLWDARSGEPCGPAIFSGRDLRATALAVHPGGRAFITTYESNLARRWTLPDCLPDDRASVIRHIETRTRLRQIPGKNQLRTLSAAEWGH